MQPRIYLPALLALALLAGLWLRSAGRNEGPAASPVAIDTDGEGYGMYQKLKCSRCHGAQLDGTRKAPELLGLSEHYDASRLASYLANPDSMQSVDERLGELNVRFRAHDMPEYRLKERARSVLIGFLLAPERREVEIEG